MNDMNKQINKWIKLLALSLNVAVLIATPAVSAENAAKASTEAPNTSTEAPNTSTEAPNTSTEAPKTSTEAPKTSTEAPKTSTAVLAEQVDAVALITITHVSSLVNRGMSIPGLLSVEAFSYQLDVNRLWKGEIPMNAELKISLENCSTPLVKGESYLVFGNLTPIPKGSRTTLEEPVPLSPATGKPSLEWVTKSCEQSIPAAQAQQRMAQLDQLFRSRVAQHSQR